jgi:hypothetical protein
MAQRHMARSNTDTRGIVTKEIRNLARPVHCKLKHNNSNNAIASNSNATKPPFATRIREQASKSPVRLPKKSSKVHP